MSTATDGAPASETQFKFINRLEDRYVPIKLSEVQRIRDQLAKIRHTNSLTRALWSQVAGLYQRLSTAPTSGAPKE